MKKTLLALALALFFSGCMTTQTQTQVHPSKAVFLDPAKPGKKVFISAKSSGCAYELGSLISSKLINNGCKIADSSANAGKANR